PRDVVAGGRRTSAGRLEVGVDDVVVARVAGGLRLALRRLPALRLGVGLEELQLLGELARQGLEAALVGLLVDGLLRLLDGRLQVLLLLVGGAFGVVERLLGCSRTPSSWFLASAS